MTNKKFDIDLLQSFDRILPMMLFAFSTYVHALFGFNCWLRRVMRTSTVNEGSTAAIALA